MKPQVPDPKNLIGKFGLVTGIMAGGLAAIMVIVMRAKSHKEYGKF